MTTHADLERDLRAAADLYADIPIAPDAWQQNQRRVAASRGRRTRSWLAGAAVLVAVALVASLVLLTGGGTNGGPPAHGGGDDAFAPENLLGPVVTLETISINGERVAHEAALSDTSGKGPSLCDRYETSSGGAEGCASREPNADDPDIAIDWLMGSGGTGDQHGIVAGVDARVSAVKVWLADGEERRLPLRDGVWEGVQLGGLTVPAETQAPQRLVAYGPDGVLQVIDLAQRFGEDWLSLGSRCNELGSSVDLPEVSAEVAAEPGFAGISVNGQDFAAKGVCLPLTETMQGITIGPRGIVLVVGPEVESATVQGVSDSSIIYRPPTVIPGTIWRVMVLQVDRDLVARDVIQGFGVGREAVDELSVLDLS